MRKSEHFAWGEFSSWWFIIFFFKIRGKNERRLFGLVKWIFHEFRDFANIILCVYTVKPQIIWMLIKVLKYFSSQEWGVIFWMKKSALYKHFPHFISFFYCPRAFHYSNHLTFPSHYGLVKMFPFHVISLVVLAACLQTENGMKNLCNIYFARWKNSWLKFQHLDLDRKCSYFNSQEQKPTWYK